MTYYIFELEKDGQMNMLETNDGLDVQLNVDKDTEKVHLQVATKKDKVIWTGRYIPKKTIYDSDIITLRKKLKIPFDIALNKELVHQSRTHPRYATFFNHNMLKLREVIGSENNVPIMKERSWGNGLLFIGSALVKFITDVYVYETIGMSGTAEEYQQLSDYLTRKNKFTEINESLDWCKYLAYNGEKLPINSKKGQKAYSDMVKALMGAIYQSNGQDKLPRILDIVQQIILPNSSMEWSSYSWYYTLTGFVMGFGLGILFMSIMMYPL